MGAWACLESVKPLPMAVPTGRLLQGFSTSCAFLNHTVLLCIFLLNDHPIRLRSPVSVAVVMKKIMDGFLVVYS